MINVLCPDLRLNPLRAVVQNVRKRLIFRSVKAHLSNLYSTIGNS